MKNNLESYAIFMSSDKIKVLLKELGFKNVPHQGINQKAIELKATIKDYIVQIKFVIEKVSVVDIDKETPILSNIMPSVFRHYKDIYVPKDITIVIGTYLIPIGPGECRFNKYISTHIEKSWYDITIATDLTISGLKTFVTDVLEDGINKLTEISVFDEQNISMNKLDHCSSPRKWYAKDRELKVAKVKAVFNAFAYPSDQYDDYLFNYQDVLEKIIQRQPFKTNHMYEMANCWDKAEYDVYIVDELGNEHFVDNSSNLTPKDLRPEHNIHKIWKATGFCDYTNNRHMVYSERVRNLQKGFRNE